MSYPNEKIGSLNHSLELLAVLEFSGNVNMIMTLDLKDVAVFPWKCHRIGVCWQTHLLKKSIVYEMTEMEDISMILAIQKWNITPKIFPEDYFKSLILKQLN